MATSGAHDPIYVFSNVSWAMNIWRCSSKDDKSMLTSLHFFGILTTEHEKKDTVYFWICLSSFLCLPATQAECIFILTHWLLFKYMQKLAVIIWSKNITWTNSYSNLHSSISLLLLNYYMQYFLFYRTVNVFGKTFGGFENN